MTTSTITTRTPRSSSGALRLNSSWRKSPNVKKRWTHYTSEMYDYRAHERARRQLTLLGQITRTERNGNEQQAEQGRPCRSYQNVKVVPLLQRFDRPHYKTPDAFTV